MEDDGELVQLYVYDLSGGIAAQLSHSLLGRRIEAIYHTSIVVGGVECYYGGGIQEAVPGRTPHGCPFQVIDLGRTHIPADVRQEFLVDISDRFSPENYSLMHNNCNNFSDEVAQFLVGEGIPPHITGLPAEVMATPFGALIQPMIQAMEQRLTSVDQRQRAITHPHPHPATLQQAAPVAAADAAAGVQRQRHPPSLTAASAAPAAPTPRAPLRSPGPSLAPPTPAAAAASVQLRGLETPVRGSARERYATSPSEGSPAAADIPAVVQTPPPMAAPQQPPPLPKGRPWEPTPTLKAVFDDEREAAREGARQDLPEIPRHQRAPPRPLPPTPVAARRLRRTAQAAAAAAAEANAAAFAAALQPPAAPPGSAADAPVPDGASSIPRVADTVQQQQDAAAAPQASQPAVASDAAAPAPDGCSMSAAASVKTPQENLQAALAVEFRRQLAAGAPPNQAAALAVQALRQMGTAPPPRVH